VFLSRWIKAPEHCGRQTTSAMRACSEEWFGQPCPVWQPLSEGLPAPTCGRDHGKPWAAPQPPCAQGALHALLPSPSALQSKLITVFTHDIIVGWKISCLQYYPWTYFYLSRNLTQGFPWSTASDHINDFLVRSAWDTSFLSGFPLDKKL